MRDEQYEHLHTHLERLAARLDVIDDAVERLRRLEIATSRLEQTLMAKASEQLTQLTTKLNGMGSVLTDMHSDYLALLAAFNAQQGQLDAEGQAALDAANARADALASQLRDFDVEIGDADGSDIPAPSAPAETPTTPGAGGDTAPVEAPPATTPDAGTPADGGTPTDPEADAPPAGEGTVFAPDVPADGGDADVRPTA